MTLNNTDKDNIKVLRKSMVFMIPSLLHVKYPPLGSIGSYVSYSIYVFMTWGPGSMESWGDRSFAELALKISCTMWVPRHSVSWPVLDTSHHHECWSKSNRFPQILGYIPIISPSYPPQMMLDINHLLFLELFVFTYPFAHCPSAPLLEQRWQHRRLRPVTGMEWERRLGGIRGNISTSSNPS